MMPCVSVWIKRKNDHDLPCSKTRLGFLNCVITSMLKQIITPLQKGEIQCHGIRLTGWTNIFDQNHQLSIWRFIRRINHIQVHSNSMNKVWICFMDLSWCSRRMAYLTFNWLVTSLTSLLLNGNFKIWYGIVCMT